LPSSTPEQKLEQKVEARAECVIAMTQAALVERNIPLNAELNAGRTNR
jgi:hypothetical protein